MMLYPQTNTVANPIDEIVRSFKSYLIKNNVMHQQYDDKSMLENVEWFLSQRKDSEDSKKKFYEYCLKSGLLNKKSVNITDLSLSPEEINHLYDFYVGLNKSINYAFNSCLKKTENNGPFYNDNGKVAGFTFCTEVQNSKIKVTEFFSSDICKKNNITALSFNIKDQESYTTSGTVYKDENNNRHYCVSEGTTRLRTSFFKTTKEGAIIRYTVVVNVSANRDVELLSYKICTYQKKNDEKTDHLTVQKFPGYVKAISTKKLAEEPDFNPQKIDWSSCKVFLWSLKLQEAVKKGRCRIVDVNEESMNESEDLVLRTKTDEQIWQLQNRIVKLNTQASEKQKESQNRVEEVAKLQNELEKNKSTHEEKIVELQSRIDELNTQSSAKQTELQNRAEEVTKLQEELANTKNQLTAAEKGFQQGANALSTLKTEKQKLEENIAELERAKKELESSRSESKEETKELQSKIDGLSEQFLESNAKSQEKSSEINELREELADTQNQLIAAEKGLQRGANELTALKAEKQEQQEKLVENIAELERAKKELEDSRSESEKKITDLQKALVDTKNKLAIAEEILQQRTGEIAELQDALTALTTKNQKQQENLEAQTALISEYEASASNEELKWDNSDINESPVIVDIRTLVDDVLNRPEGDWLDTFNAVGTGSLQREEEFAKLQNELTDLKTEKQKLEEKMTENITELEASLYAHKEITKELENSKSESEEEIKLLKSKVRGLIEKLKKSQDNLNLVWQENWQHLKIKKQKASILQANTEIAQHGSYIFQADTKIEQLRASILQANEKISQSENKICELNRQLNDERQNPHEQSQDNLLSQRTIQQLTEQLAKAQDKLKAKVPAVNPEVLAEMAERLTKMDRTVALLENNHGHPAATIPPNNAHNVTHVTKVKTPAPAVVSNVKTSTSYHNNQINDRRIKKPQPQAEPTDLEARIKVRMQKMKDYIGAINDSKIEDKGKCTAPLMKHKGGLQQMLEHPDEDKFNTLVKEFNKEVNNTPELKATLQSYQERQKARDYDPDTQRPGSASSVESDDSGRGSSSNLTEEEGTNSGYSATITSNPPGSDLSSTRVESLKLVGGSGQVGPFVPELQ